MVDSQRNFPSTPRAFEEKTAEFLRHKLGDLEAAVTPDGPDSGLDVVGEWYCAQSKFYADRPVGRPEVQQLLGASIPLSLTPVFCVFLGGYTEGAIAFAESTEVLLYEFDPDRIDFVAVNDAAHEAVMAQEAQAHSHVQSRPVEGSLSTDPRTTREPGFYVDPWSEDLFRYWDGHDWTNLVRFGNGAPFRQ